MENSACGSGPDFQEHREGQRGGVKGRTQIGGGRGQHEFEGTRSTIFLAFSFHETLART